MKPVWASFYCSANWESYASAISALLSTSRSPRSPAIDIETAISRKPDHDYAELQDKIGVMSKIGYNGTKILEIDSRAPYSEVLEQAQKAVSLVAIVSDRRSLT